MSAEKNDVDISALFNFGSKYEIEIGDKKIPVYIRLVGDADLNRARVFAIRRSAELRKKLKDTDSDESIALIPDTDDYTDELLIETILNLSAQDITRKVINELDFPYPNDLDSEASLEEQERYQAEVDNYPIRRADKIRAESLAIIEKNRKELKTLSREALEKEYKNKIINNHCEREMMQVFSEYSTYLGCYKDKNYKIRLFNSFDEFNNLITDIKNQLMNFYDSLEIDSEALKK